MEKVFFGYSVSINKKQRKPALKDVKAVNDSTKDYMLSLSKEDIKERINECSIDSQAQPFENLLNSKLHDLGIVILNQAFDLKYIERVNQELIDIQSRIDDFLKAGSQFYEDEDILFQRGSKKLKGYSELSNYSKTVVQVREGQDEGMIDIFNIDRSSEVFRGMLESLKSSQTIKALTSQRTQVTPKNMNVYLNSGVQSTRGFHVDTYTEKLKVFVYLTDCMDLSNGPYT
ncbi:hypothetical protein BZG11_13925, partial [Salinivibrio kushneri]|uniref:hypothetical protein n=1 Tax=Salinivibrio kushneri TaxID=1908198 RepID=UPI0009CFE6EF